MATWKSDKIKADVDFHIEYAESDTWWEYQTTADIFTFHQQGKTPSYFSKKEDFHHIDGFDNSKAKLLFQALYNWIEIYEGEKTLEALIKENPFSKEDK